MSTRHDRCHTGIPRFIIPPQVIRDFATVRARVRAAVAACPKTVTLEQARAQIELFRKAKEAARPCT